MRAPDALNCLGLSHFVDPSVYEHLSTVSKGEFYNAVGFLSYAEEKLNKTDKPKKPTVSKRRVKNI